MKSEISRSRSRIKSKQEFSHVNNNIPAPISQRFNNNFSIDFLIKKKIPSSFPLFSFPFFFFSETIQIIFPSHLFLIKLQQAFPSKLNQIVYPKSFDIVRMMKEIHSCPLSLSPPPSFPLPPKILTRQRDQGREDGKIRRRIIEKRGGRNRDEIFSPSSSHVRNIRDDIGGCVHQKTERLIFRFPVKSGAC